jgi:predicted DCC family thiol-disulfide oxidoreductase YuxK
MKNGWTGGQYSLYRFVFGLYLFIHFCQLLPWSGELFSNQGMVPDSHLSPFIHLFPNILAFNDSFTVVFILSLIGLAASLFFIAGKWDRIAAIVLWYVLASFFGRNPLIANPSLPFVGWLLLAHCILPKAPFGSLAARNRIDPAGGWILTPSIFLAAWVVMSLGYTYSGIMKLYSPSWLDGTAFSYLLQNPLVRDNTTREFFLLFSPFLLKAMTWGALALEVFFAPLALIKKLRPWLWMAMLFMHIGLLKLLNFADLTWGMIILHFFTFDPGWVKPRPVDNLTIYYDGTCGFCHSFIRFVLSENKNKLSFRFAPLQSCPSIGQNSLAVEEKGRLLFKSKAVFRVLASLGGIWKVLAFFLSWVPVRLSDFAYEQIARIRHRLFAKPKDLCPIIPQELRDYFKE